MKTKAEVADVVAAERAKAADEYRRSAELSKEVDNLFQVGFDLYRTKVKDLFPTLTCRGWTSRKSAVKKQPTQQLTTTLLRSQVKAQLPMLKPPKPRPWSLPPPPRLIQPLLLQ